MRRTLYLLLFLIVALPLAAASNDNFKIQKVDLNKIKKESLDSDSKFYFPKLFKKYISNDTVMTIEDYRYLYYGYVFQEDYNPYRVSEYSSYVEKLYYKSKHSRSECDSIMKYAELALADNIFDLRQMQFLIIALKEKRKDARASIWQFRFKRLIAAILSSGNGTKDMPWMVINPAHEYNILNFWNLYAVEHKTLDGNIDYLKVAKNKKNSNPEGFYFDVSPVVNVYNKKFIDD